jgi:hypothetical protein
VQALHWMQEINHHCVPKAPAPPIGSLCTCRHILLDVALLSALDPEIDQAKVSPHAAPPVSSMAAWQRVQLTWMAARGCTAAVARRAPLRKYDPCPPTSRVVEGDT